MGPFNLGALTTVAELEGDPPSPPRPRVLSDCDGSLVPNSAIKFLNPIPGGP